MVQENGAKRVFPNAPTEALDRLWKEGRCGLFHCGFTDGPTYLTHGKADAIGVSGKDININILQFVNAVDADFKTYVKVLKDRSDMVLVRNFEVLWDLRWENS